MGPLGTDPRGQAPSGFSPAARPPQSVARPSWMDLLALERDLARSRRARRRPRAGGVERRMALLTRLGLFGADTRGTTIRRALTVDELSEAHHLVAETTAGAAVLGVDEASPDMATFIAVAEWNERAGDLFDDPRALARLFIEQSGLLGRATSQERDWLRAFWGPATFAQVMCAAESPPTA